MVSSAAPLASDEERTNRGDDSDQFPSLLRPREENVGAPLCCNETSDGRENKNNSRDVRISVEEIIGNGGRHDCPSCRWCFQRDTQP